MLAASMNSKSAKVVWPVEFDLHQTETVVGDNRAERHEHHRGCHVHPVERAGERGVYEDAGGYNAPNPTPPHVTRPWIRRPVRHSASTVSGTRGMDASAALICAAGMLIARLLPASGKVHPPRPASTADLERHAADHLAMLSLLGWGRRSLLDGGRLDALRPLDL